MSFRETDSIRALAASPPVSRLCQYDSLRFRSGHTVLRARGREGPSPRAETAAWRAMLGRATRRRGAARSLSASLVRYSQFDGDAVVVLETQHVRLVG